MKKGAQKAKMEPTLGEFFEFVKERFDQVDEKFLRVDERFEKIDERFDRVDERFGLVEARIDQRFGLANERMNNIDARLGDIQRQVNKTQVMVADVQDDLTTLSAALDQDSERVVNHEQRIEKLEAVRS